MIGIIFSYAKSAVLFVVTTAALAAGIVCVCLFTSEVFDLTVRLIGLGVLLLATYIASIAYVCKLVAAEIERVGWNECDAARLQKRLRALSRRTVIGGMRGALLLECAHMQIVQNDCRNAMVTVSDAIVAGKDEVKADAAVRFCEIYYALDDAEYFCKYYDKAVAALAGHATDKSAASRAAALATTAEIEAMRLSMQGEKEKAKHRIEAVSLADVPPLYRKKLDALLASIAP